MFDQLPGLFVHNLQLQKSPSRIFGQNSGNSVDISKVFFEIVIWKFESSQVSQAVTQLEIETHESDKCPPIAAFCELAVRLYTPNLHNLGAKLSIVSGLHLKYSRFLETRARDRARSALRGVEGSQPFKGDGTNETADL